MRKTKKYKIIVFLMVLAVSGVLLMVLEKTGVLNLYETHPSNTTTATIDDATKSINLAPPTTAEQQTASDQKIINETLKNKDAVPDTAKVAIVDASVYDEIAEVRAFVANIVEDGSCKITFSRNNLSFEKIVPASADASTTLCATLNVPVSEFPEQGEWQVNVNFSNDRISGNASTTIAI